MVLSAVVFLSPQDHLEFNRKQMKGFGGREKYHGIQNNTYIFMYTVSPQSLSLKS